MTWEIRRQLAEQVSREAGTRQFPPGTRQDTALVYPNTYQLGMSNLGLHILYQLINAEADMACERFFLPNASLRKLYEKTNTPLLSMETQRPLSVFGVIGVVLSFEMDYFHFLEVLSMGRVPLLAAERQEADSFVVVGGPCATFNPEPVADFVDAVVIGEGEETFPKMARLIHEARRMGTTRKEILRQLAALPHVYVPSLYEAVYDAAGSFVCLEARNGAPAAVSRGWVKDLDAVPGASAIVTPDTEFSNVYLLEVARGCGRHCRFCMAGYCFRRPRQRSKQKLVDQVALCPAQTERIGLMGAAVSDYDEMLALGMDLQGQGRSFSVASLRADSLTPELVAQLAAGGQRTLTVAPEAGSERMRRIINKGIQEEDIFRAVALASSSGMPHLKLYFMIGLPEETQTDVEAIADMVLRVRAKMLECGSRGDLTISVNPFVPKPFTPFQWQPLQPLKTFEQKVAFLKKSFEKDRRIKLIAESGRETLLQAVLARGDRRVGAVLLAAFQAGGEKKFRRLAEAEAPENMARLTAGWQFDEALPWDHLFMGFDKHYLWQEWQKALKEEATAVCQTGCRRCGVCGAAETGESNG